MTTSIILTTLNARYSHCAFGLRYIYANMGDLQASTAILEFTINQNTRDIVETILKTEPQVVGFGVYIWNTQETLEVVSMLKRIKPELKIVLGGPEVSYETELQEICQLADVTIKGESDLIFPKLCSDFLLNQCWPVQKTISGELPELKKLSLPYKYYSDHDVQNRVIYVEASRGCPYKCEYCLSSLDKSVRSFDLDLFLTEMDLLIQRGARQFKFVDRTFNLSIPTSMRILQFFLDRISFGLFLHFEMVPDRLPLELGDLLKKFPAGSLQFEVGIQTWNPEVAKLVSRRQDYKKIVENFKFLNSETGVHTHADLIVGLPGETLESFAQGFDAVAAHCAPHEIQVGILKRLRGTPIIRHDQEWKMVYQAIAPYQVLSTRTMNYFELQSMNRFANFWNLIVNSGNFKSTYKLLAEIADKSEKRSLFWEFNEMVIYLSEKHPQGHGIALYNLMQSLWRYLTENKKYYVEAVNEAIIQDFNKGSGKHDIPSFMKAELRIKQEDELRTNLKKSKLELTSVPKRQRRHLEKSQQSPSDLARLNLT